MSIKVVNNPSKKVFEAMEAGSYACRIYSVIHEGTVEGYQGMPQNKIRITWEFPSEMKVFKEENGEQPRVMSNEYTLSLNEKANLMAVIQACDSKGIKINDDGYPEYDVENLIGKTCLVEIVVKKRKDGEGDVAFISNTVALPKGMTCGDAINPPVTLSYENWNEELYQKLPDFLKKKIQSSKEYREMRGNHSDIP